MVIFNTKPAIGAFSGVDDIGFLALRDSADGTHKRASAALDAIFCYFISHEVSLILYQYYTISGNILKNRHT